MASIDSDGKGRWRIRFTGVDKRRRAIRISGINKRDAQTLQHHVEQIVAAATVGNPPPDATSRWLATVSDVVREKLAAVGLVEARKSALLGEFIAGYIVKRTDVKPRTVTMWKQVERNLLAYFGARTPLRDITAGDAEDFRRWLLRDKEKGGGGAGLSTANKRCSVARQFFKHACRHRVLSDNPFTEVETTNVANRERDFFITQEMATAVLDACPDAEWRLIFALSRFAGFRCPSEHTALKWSDINWHTSRIALDSPKTGLRVLPVFDRLRPYLEDADALAEDGAVYVIDRNRGAEKNLRTTFMKIVKRAGLEPWPKLFHNLRASCQTELQEVFPAHVVCGWLGNSVAVAMKHYLQTTDEHFAAATKVDHNVAHHTAETGQPTAVSSESENANTPDLPGSSVVDRETASDLVVPDGIEPSFPGCDPGVVAVGPRDCGRVKV